MVYSFILAVEYLPPIPPYPSYRSLAFGMTIKGHLNPIHGNYSQSFSFLVPKVFIKEKIFTQLIRF